MISRQKIQTALAMDSTELGVCPSLSQIRTPFDIHLFETLPSTNTHLWKMLKAKTLPKAAAGTPKAAAGTVVIARQQSAGRGQRDRIWHSSPGGLYLSLALEPDWPVTHSAQLTCLSAWGIATAFNNLGIPIRVKWPNDLFYNGKKLGGILTETKLSQPSRCAPTPSSNRENLNTTAHIKQAVIGVGLNWHNSVPQTGTTLTKILESGSYGHAKTKINCLEILIAVVLRGILQGYFYQQRVGSQVFMKTYEKLLTQVGKTVSVEKGLIVPTSVSDSTASDLAVSDSVSRYVSRCSGKVVGVSEEGYLEVALQPSARHLIDSPANSKSLASSSPQVGHPINSQSEHILLIRPSEIHI